MQREHIAYILALLMDMCLMATIFFAVTRRAADAGFDAMRLGWLGAAFFITYCFFAPLCGKLSDHFGRRRFMVAGMIVAGLVLLVCAYETRFAPLVALCTITGVAAAIFWPALMAWLSEGRRGVALVGALSIYCIFWNAGLMLGSFGSSLLYEVDQRLSFFVFGGIILCAPLLFLLPERTSLHQPQANQPMALNISREKALYFMWAAWLSNLAALLGLAAVTALFPQLATELGIRPALHGQIIAASRAAAVVAFVIMRCSHAWHHRTWPMIAGCIVSIAGALAVAVTNDVSLFFAGFIALGFVNGATYLMGIFYAMEAFEGKAVGAGWTEMILGGASFIGPVAAGYVGEAWGLRAPYFFAAVLFAAGLMAQIGLALAARRYYKLPAEQ